MGVLIALSCLVPSFVVLPCCIRLYLIINAAIGAKNGVGAWVNAIWSICLNKGNQDQKYKNINLKLQISTAIVVNLAPGAIIMVPSLRPLPHFKGSGDLTSAATSPHTPTALCSLSGHRVAERGLVR